MSSITPRPPATGGKRHLPGSFRPAFERPGTATLALERLLLEVQRQGVYRPATWWALQECAGELTAAEREQLDDVLCQVAERLEARRDLGRRRGRRLA